MYYCVFKCQSKVSYHFKSSSFSFYLFHPPIDASWPCDISQPYSVTPARNIILILAVQTFFHWNLQLSLSIRKEKRYYLRGISKKYPPNEATSRVYIINCNIPFVRLSPSIIREQQTHLLIFPERFNLDKPTTNWPRLIMAQNRFFRGTDACRGLEWPRIGITSDRVYENRITL